jgi:YfiH family protein
VASDAAWWFETIEGLTLARCVLLTEIPRVAHAFSTRQADGGGDFDLGRAGEDGEPWSRRRRRLASAAGIAGRGPAMLLQVHGARVLRARDLEEMGAPRADALLALHADGAQRAPAVRVADCVPVLIADRRGRAVAAVHAGWRGTARGIVGRTVRELTRLGLDPAGLSAAVGPAIGRCCYEVSDDVLAHVSRASGGNGAALAATGPSGRPMLDLRRANRLQLENAGLPPGRISCAPWCTSCEAARFYSFRREGEGTGRMMACIGWSEPGDAP